MCIHNDEDGYDCLACCRECGKDDANDGIKYAPPYKNYDQVDAYSDGYNQATKEQLGD